jgi:hypothetical protein
MKEEYITDIDFKNISSYYKMLGVDVNSELMKYINDEINDSPEGETKWFAKRMDTCVREAIQEHISTNEFEKYKYVLIG